MASIIPVEDGDRYATPSTAAFDVNKDIRSFLDGLDVTKIDIARQSPSPQPVKAQLSSLPLKRAGLAKRPLTMSPSRSVFLSYSGELFAVTVRRKLFLSEAGNTEYRSLLGPEYTPLKRLPHERDDVASGFKYPEDGLLPLQGMLIAEQIRNPDTKNLQGNPTHRVLKRGFTTNTTVGTVTGFMAFNFSGNHSQLAI